MSEPKSLDELDDALDKDLAAAGVNVEKSDGDSEDSPETPAAETTEDTTETALDEALTKDSTKASETTTDKTSTTKEEVDVDAEILKALESGDATPAGSDDEVVKEIFSTFDALEKYATENKLDNPALKKVLGYAQTIVDYAENVAATEEALVNREQKFQRKAAVLSAEFAELLQPLGLDEKVFSARNWPQLLHAAFERKYKKSEAAPSPLDTIEDDDDIPMTKADAKKLVKSYLAQAPAAPTKNATETPALTEAQMRQTLEQENAKRDAIALVPQRVEYWISKDPLLSAMSKRSEQTKKTIFDNVMRQLGNDPIAVLGRDKSGTPIKKIIDEYSSTTRETLKAAGLSVAPKAPAKPGTPTPRAGGRPSTGVQVDMKTPALYKDVDGKKVKVSSDDAMEEFDTEFDKMLGIKL